MLVIYTYIKINHYTNKESCEIHEVNRLFPPLIITLVAKYKLIMPASSIACVVPNDVENSWKRLILPLSPSHKNVWLVYINIRKMMLAMHEK